jgi:hypothetical protein
VCVVKANAAQTAATCDRECLRGKITQLLYAFVKHDVSKLPVADTWRVTEDAIEKPLAKVGLVNTVTRLRGFRQDIIDERAGVAGADVVVEESGAPVLLVVRLKVVAGQADRDRARGHAQPRRRAYLQHRWPERAERSDELRAAPRAAFDPRRGHPRRRCTIRPGSTPRRPSPT